MVSLAVFAALFVQPAAASKRLIVGIYDEAETLGRPDRAFPMLQRLRAKAVRANLYWGGPSGVSRRRPARGTNPNDRSYDWFKYDRMVREAAKRKIRVVFAIVGTPRWANGGKPFNRAPLLMRHLRNFAQAAATRYSGSFRPIDVRIPNRRVQQAALPAVRHWLAWNEPNNPIFLSPQFIPLRKGVFLRQAAKDYAKICNTIVAGVHAASRLRGEKIGCGVTA